MVMIKYLITYSLFLSNFIVSGITYEVKMLNQGTTGVMVFEPAVLKINPDEVQKKMDKALGRTKISEVAE